jgi:hypothetical protein
LLQAYSDQTTGRYAATASRWGAPSRAAKTWSKTSSDAPLVDAADEGGESNRAPPWAKEPFVLPFPCSDLESVASPAEVGSARACGATAIHAVGNASGETIGSLPVRGYKAEKKAGEKSYDSKPD